MGLTAFVLIFGPWAAVVALLWASRDRLAALPIEAFQRSAPKPVETKTPLPPSPIEPIAEIRPDAEPASEKKTGLPEHDPKR